MTRPLSAECDADEDADELRSEFGAGKAHRCTVCKGWSKCLQGCPEMDDEPYFETECMTGYHEECGGCDCICHREEEREFDDDSLKPPSRE